VDVVKGGKSALVRMVREDMSQGGGDKTILQAN
jgi:hypothetical protein